MRLPQPGSFFWTRVAVRRDMSHANPAFPTVPSHRPLLLKNHRIQENLPLYVFLRIVASCSKGGLAVNDWRGLLDQFDQRKLCKIIRLYRKRGRGLRFWKLTIARGAGPSGY
jgi:hypothetical protein